MTFTLDRLGLSKGAIGDNYDDKRDKCFHSGVDYKTNKVETPFKAAIYGKVVNPIGGNWGTISVKPFNSNDLIQYLHCSSINVKWGDIVYPWTTLGKTGEVCPTGKCSGIHLHLQVVSNGKPKYSCWSRDYKDPNKWNQRNPIIGTWFDNETIQHRPGMTSKTYRTLSMGSDKIGSDFNFDLVWLLSRSVRGKVCEYRIIYKYMMKVLGRNDSGLKVKTRLIRAYIDSVSSSDCTALNLSFTSHNGTISLLKDNKIKLKLGNSYNRDYSLALPIYSSNNMSLGSAREVEVADYDQNNNYNQIYDGLGSSIAFDELNDDNMIE